MTTKCNVSINTNYSEQGTIMKKSCDFLFEKVDDENKLTAEKNELNENFHKRN